MTQISFQDRANHYLALREALGFQTRKSRPILKSFAEFLEQNCKGSGIRAEVVIDWVCKSAPNCGVSGRWHRLMVLRGFLFHLSATIPDVEIPSMKMLAAPVRTSPFVFTWDQVVCLLDEAGAPERNARCTLNPYVAQTLFGLMACTGLRPSESRKLSISDVFLQQGPPRLLVRGSKFNKSRWVPLHPSAATQLMAYLEWRKRFKTGKSCTFLFVSKQGQELSYKVVQRFFNRTVERLKLHVRANQLSPGLHSLRHSFTVERLRRWYEAGADVQSLMPNLSIYLGHVNLSSTYWYLSATPELMTSAGKSFESYSEGGSK